MPAPVWACGGPAPDGSEPASGGQARRALDGWTPGELRRGPGGRPRALPEQGGQPTGPRRRRPRARRRAPRERSSHGEAPGLPAPLGWQRQCPADASWTRPESDDPKSGHHREGASNNRGNRRRGNRHNYRRHNRLGSHRRGNRRPEQTPSSPEPAEALQP